MKRLAKITNLTLMAVLCTFGFTTLATAATTKNTSLNAIIAKGNNAITSRLNSLASVSQNLNTPKLSATDQASLASEINTASVSLNQLRTRLNADTDITAAQQDYQAITTDYRVYALMIPKVRLIKIADAQQAKETQLMTFATTLKSRVTAKDSALNSSVTAMMAKIAAASTLSKSVETATLSLNAKDYDNDHQLLTTQLGSLKTAQADNSAAYSDGLAIMNALKQ